MSHFNISSSSPRFETPESDTKSNASDYHEYAFEAFASSLDQNQGCTQRGALESVKLGVSTDIIPCFKRTSGRSSQSLSTQGRKMQLSSAVTRVSHSQGSGCLDAHPTEQGGRSISSLNRDATKGTLRLTSDSSYMGAWLVCVGRV